MSDAGTWAVMSIEEADARLTAPGSYFEISDAVVLGRPMKIWANALPSFAAGVEQMRQYEDREYAVYGDERVSYAGLLRAIETFADFLVSQGVRKGDRVALAMRNLPEWPIILFAVTSIGAVFVPLNAWWTAAELERALDDSGAVMLVGDAQRIAAVMPRRDTLPNVRDYVVSRGEVEGARTLESLLGKAPDWHLLPSKPMPRVDIHPDDPATIFYTSGTTSSPKGVVGSHRAAMTTQLTHIYSVARVLLRLGAEAPPTGVQKVMMCGVPFFHVTGCHTAVMMHLLVGNKMVMAYRWDAGEALRLIEQERVTITGGVPTIAWQLLEHPDRPQRDLSSLENIGYGGAPAAPELQRRLAKDMGLLVGTGWGMTETSSTVMAHVGPEYATHPESCGPATPVSRQRIVDPDTGEVLGMGGVGELQVYGPMIAAGYWNKPEATAQTFVDGWLRTGDLARVDEEGFYYLVGRCKDLILRGGENIYPAEVEAALFEHPAIDDAAVLGIPDDRLGELPAAVVHVLPGHDVGEQELRDWVAARLAGFKVPSRVIALPDLLPRNANGKVLKQELARLFE